MSSMIPLVDLQAQYASIRDDIDGAMRTVIERAGFIMGPEIDGFERRFAQFCSVDHCIAVSSGTAALELTLRALGVGPGDEVITVAHTFIATAEAISATGARPVFVDIDPLTYNIDPHQLRSAIGERTRAILPVHIYGQPADMSAINEVAERFDLPVIEDAAQAHGALLQGKPAGSLGRAACFSFYPGKNLGAFGDAGAITTDDDELAHTLRLIRNHGRRSKYLHEVVGYGQRMDTLQAAILSAKLPHLDGWIQARRRLATRYTALLSEMELILPHVAEGSESAWHLYVVRTPCRDELLDFLRRNDVGAGVHYPIPLHLQPAYSSLGYEKGDLPVTEAVADTCLSLPLYPEMSDAQQERVVEAIRSFTQVTVLKG